MLNVRVAAVAAGIREVGHGTVGACGPMLRRGTTRIPAAAGPLPVRNAK